LLLITKAQKKRTPESSHRLKIYPHDHEVTTTPTRPFDFVSSLVGKIKDAYTLHAELGCGSDDESRYGRMCRWIESKFQVAKVPVSIDSRTKPPSPIPCMQWSAHSTY
jgi:hypothetical protein